MGEREDWRGAEAGLKAEEAYDLEVFDPADFEPRPFTLPDRRRSLVAVGALSAVILMAVLPPLINVNRYRRQIARSISASLGRPVRMDAVTLNVLPIPGFTLDNFVVGEDPAFGWEPVVRATSVRARLRLGSLWRGRVEFSRISLTDASVNLVHREDGRWNIESILLQASRMEAAPTAQRTAGEAPRFPYIEATGARVNVKMGLEKMPLALTEGEFALWLPKPEQWRLRLEGHPSRTDMAATDTGTVRVQGTLGKAGTRADVPVELTAEWSAAPLGGVSKVLTGADAGLRGDMTLMATVTGKIGENRVDSRLQLRQVRRAEFVPARSLDVDVVCQAQALGVFHRLVAVQCAWPPEAEQSGAGGLVANGAVGDVRSWKTAQIEARWRGVPLSSVADVLREASSRVPQGLQMEGTAEGRMACCGEGGSVGSAGEFHVADTRVSVGGAALQLEDEIAGKLDGDKLTVGPLALGLGGAQRAMLAVQADGEGIRMHLTGMVLRSRLLALGEALPQFGDGLEAGLKAGLPEAAPGAEAPIRVDLASTRGWSGGQVWTAAPFRPASGKRSARRH